MQNQFGITFQLQDVPVLLKLVTDNVRQQELVQEWEVSQVMQQKKLMECFGWRQMEHLHFLEVESQ